MRSSNMIRMRVIAIAAASVAASAETAGAQLANASTAATGLGGAYTARAQGYNAVFWNPANLAMPGNPGFSFTIGAVDGMAGLSPIDLSMIAKAGSMIDSATRESWMKLVEADGRQRGDLGGGITSFAMSIGSLALQVSHKTATTMDLAPGGVEAILFGNLGRTYPTPRPLSLAGSALTSSTYSTAAVSYGMGLPLIPLPNFKVGVTGKYILGHALIAGQDAGSTISSNSVDVDFPFIMSDTADLKVKRIASGQGSSTGMGLDVGAAWTIPGFRFGVSMQNVVNTFKWDTTTLFRRTVSGILDPASPDDSNVGLDSTQYPYSTAPAVLRERVAAMKFKPVISAGVVVDWLPKVTVSADIRQQVAGGIEVGPESMIGAGAEVRLIPLLPLRGGVQLVNGGMGFSGGVGLRLAGFELGVAGFLRKRAGLTESGGTLNLISFRP
jgi:hypothetical protein